MQPFCEVMTGTSGVWSRANGRGFMELKSICWSNLENQWKWHNLFIGTHILWKCEGRFYNTEVTPKQIIICSSGTAWVTFKPPHINKFCAFLVLLSKNRPNIRNISSIKGELTKFLKFRYFFTWSILNAYLKYFPPKCLLLNKTSNCLLSK